MPAILSNASATLQTWTTNSFTFPNFSNTCPFHSASICCFVFLAWDLQIVSALAFAYALSASKDLQAALALEQGAQDFA